MLAPLGARSLTGSPPTLEEMCLRHYGGAGPGSPPTASPSLMAASGHVPWHYRRQLTRQGKPWLCRRRRGIESRMFSSTETLPKPGASHCLSTTRRNEGGHAPTYFSHIVTATWSDKDRHLLELLIHR
ncbi:hypothetical protein ACFQ1L_34185 [Phytohabitans flavus]|uniref:hypothetical protein n=1 Tax=Phytohabitans flavus TaxID=1076124 RepID=UPI003645126E